MRGLVYTMLAICFSLMLFVLLAPLPALAGTPLSGAVAGFMEGVVFPFLTAALMTLVGWAVVKVGKKYDLEILLDNEEAIERAALKGISLAEEYAAKRLKSSDIKMTGYEKLDTAVAQVLKAAPKLTHREAEEYVEALLARLNNVGATGIKEPI